MAILPPGNRPAVPAVPAALRLALLIPLALAGGCMRPGVTSGDLPATTALDRYVDEEDPSYRWEIARTIEGDGATAWVIDMVSQRWRSDSEVDRTLWRHWLTVVVPDELEHPTALLFIGGGRNGGDPPDDVPERLRGSALRNRAVIAELRMIPNQPLTFADGRPRFEDDLIAYTWNRYMDTGDPTWPARMPMVKSAVRAMDTIETLSRDVAGATTPIDRFVVAGGSKRGWTTWLTGAVDDRVVAIVPIVIDVLNVIPSMEHHHAAYGFWAPAIGDYVRNGITDRRGDPEYEALLRLVDPYHYRHRLELPKLIINSTGDQFFLPDSSRFYFDDLIGEKHLRYVPNTDHGVFRGSDGAESLEAFFHAIANDIPRPDFSWRFLPDGSIRVESETVPSRVLLWQASHPDARDFRLETIGKGWTSRPLEPLEGDPGAWSASVPAPEEGFTAFFVELTFPSGTVVPFKFTTAVRVLPDTLPHAGDLDRVAQSND